MTEDNLKVRLRYLGEDDLKDLFRWRNDPHIMARTRQWREISWKEHTTWFDNLDLDKNLMYGIVSWTKNLNIAASLVGVCGLCHIDLINGSAEVSIYIGEEQERGRGIGWKVVERLKEVAFKSLGLHRIYAEIYMFNDPGIRLFAKCGFEHEATISDTIYRDGSWFGSRFYTLKGSNWFGSGQ